MSPPELGRCLYLTTTTNRCMVSFCKKYDVDKPYSSHFVQKLIGLNMGTVCFFFIQTCVDFINRVLNNQQRDPISNLGIIHFLWNGAVWYRRKTSLRNVNLFLQQYPTGKLLRVSKQKGPSCWGCVTSLKNGISHNIIISHNESQGKTCHRLSSESKFYVKPHLADYIFGHVSTLYPVTRHNVNLFLFHQTNSLKYLYQCHHFDWNDMFYHNSNI